MPSTMTSSPYGLSLTPPIGVTVRTVYGAAIVTNRILHRSRQTQISCVRAAMQERRKRAQEYSAKAHRSPDGTGRID